MSSKNILFKKVLFAGDFHFPDQDQSALEVLLAFKKDFKPDYTCLMGDIVDADAVSSFPGHKRSLKKQINMALDFFDKVKPTHFLEGNHCIEEGSEILTSEGFVRIEELSRDALVAQFDSKRNISFAKPLDYIAEKTESLVRIKGNFCNHVVTHGHNVIVNGSKVKAESLVGKRLEQNAIWHSGFLNNQMPAEDNNWIKLMTWLIMDGTIVDHSKYNPNSSKIRLQWKLSYEHKINKLMKLLDDMKIPYTIAECKPTGCNKLTPYYIRVYSKTARMAFDYLGGKKEIPEDWAFLPKENLDAFLMTVIDTDGHCHDGGIEWTSISDKNIDIVNRWCIFNGIDSHFKLYNNKSGFGNTKPLFRMRIRISDNCNQKITAEKIDKKCNVYCVTMPLGTIIVRQDGHVTFTGNCQRLNREGLTPSGLEEILDIKELLQLEKRKIRFAPYSNDASKGSFSFGKLRALHGFYIGEYAAAQHAKSFGTCVYGHTHRCQSFQSKQSTEKNTAFGLGCMCKLDLEYQRTGTPRGWTQGFGFAYVYPSGYFNFYNVRLIGDDFVINGRHYGRTPRSINNRKQNEVLF